MNINNRTASSILAQTIVVANEAAKSAAEAAASAASITVSPHFTGIPTAPTAAPGTNSTQIATTAYLDQSLGVANGIATLDSAGLVPVSQLPPLALTTVYTVNSQAAMLALPADVGDLAVRTDINQTFILSASPPSTLGNWTQLLFSAPVTSVAGLIGAVSASALTAALNAMVGDSGSGGTQGMVPAPAAGDNAAGKVLSAGGTWVVKANLASPAFTGTPTAPTAAVDTNTGQLATTAFVLGQASASGDGTPAMDGVASRGASTHYARADHVHPTDTSRAPLASPALTGTPTAPTASPGTNTTQIATTAYADAIAALKANLASPTFTGTPAAPTAAPGTNTTQLATTAFVQAAVGAGGIVTSVFGRTGTVVATSGDYTVAQVTGAAPLASPTFTGTVNAGSITASSNIRVTGTGGNGYQIVDTTQAADAKIWDMVLSAYGANTLAFRTVNDAFSSANAWMKVTRSGVTPTQIDIPITTDAASISSAAVVVTGGASIGKKLFVGTQIINQSGADSSLQALFAGATKGIRFGFQSTGSYIEGVDATGVGSFQPLIFGGSAFQFSSGAVVSILNNTAAGAGSGALVVTGGGSFGDGIVASGTLISLGSNAGGTSWYRNNAALANQCGYILQSAGVDKWVMRRTAGTEDFALWNPTVGSIYTVSQTTGILDFAIAPTAPTQSAGNNTTKVATTAFVQSAVAGAAPIPSSSTFPVGAYCFCQINAAVSDGGTTSGVNVKIAMATGGALFGAATQTGTWKNISGSATTSGDFGTMVRTA